MDEDDSEEMQQARLEDIEEILDNPGLQLNDESISENSQSDDDDLDSFFNIDTLLSAAHALNKELRKYNGNLKRDFDELLLRFAVGWVWSKFAIFLSKFARMNPAELTEFNCVPNLIETEFNRESTVQCRSYRK